MEKINLVYQDNFSSEYEGMMYKEEKILKKAKKTIAVLKDFLGELDNKSVLDF